MVRQINLDNLETPVPVPKRKRSSTTHGSLRSSNNTSKAYQRVSAGESMGRKMVKGNDSDLLVSLKQRTMGSDSYLNDKADESDEHDAKNPDNLKQSDKTDWLPY